MGGAHIKVLDHLLLGVVVDLAGHVGPLQERDENGRRWAVPHRAGHHLWHETVIVPKVGHLHTHTRTRIISTQKHIPSTQ